MNISLSLKNLHIPIETQHTPVLLLESAIQLHSDGEKQNQNSGYSFNLPVVMYWDVSQKPFES